MKLGFVSAILPEWNLTQIMEFAAQTGFDCVEIMCWPVGKANRRYAGVTHIDVINLTENAIKEIQELVRRTGVSISGLGYYPNPLDPDPEHRKMVSDHLKAVIVAAKKLNVGIVNTFIGRDWHKTIEDNWPVLKEVWTPIVEFATENQIKIGIENCPMIFSKDEWPGGKNLAVSPKVWRQLFAEYPNGHLGLNFDPSHLVFQHIDIPRAIREFGKHFVHVHAKDTRIDVDALYERGSMGLGWHTPKLPGLGDVNWNQFFSALTDTGYSGSVCIEVEDRAYEKSLEDRQRALRQSLLFLKQFVG